MDNSLRSDKSMLPHNADPGGPGSPVGSCTWGGRGGAWGYREQGEEAGREGGRIYWWIVWYFRPRALFLRQILLVSPMAVLLYTLLDVLNFVCSPCQFPYR